MDRTESPKSGPSGGPPSPAPFHFWLLGELAVLIHGKQVDPPPHRTQGLLAALLLHPGRQRRERLVGLLFADAPERKGRQRLSHQLWLLRQSLPDLTLYASPDEVGLPAQSRWLDVQVFRKAARQDNLDAWLAALDLYRGDLLEGIYDDWLLEEREALYLHYVRLTHRASDELLRRGRFQEALPLAERLVQREPFDERALRTLMKAYRAEGRRGAALAVYERFLSLAEDELGAEPEPATRALAQSIRSTVPSAPSAPALGSLPDDSPQALLRRAREALARGDRATVEACLKALRSAPDAIADEVRLLEIDLALLFEEYDRAEHLLDACNVGGVAKGVRAAQLAVGRHDAGAARDVAARALMLAHEAGDRETELQALLVLVQAQRQLGESTQAMRSAEQALLLARTLGSAPGLARALFLQGMGQSRQGRYNQALSCFQEAHAVALEHGLRTHQASALRGIRTVLGYQGEWEAALAASQEELSVCRDLGVESREASALEGLAAIQDMLGRTDDSLRSMELVRDISSRLGEPVRMAICQYNMAYGLLYYDDGLAPQALEAAHEALDGFRAHGQRGWEAATLIVLGYALWVDGQDRAALDYFRQASAACEQIGELGFLPEVLAYQGLAHLGLGHGAEALDLTGQAVLAQVQGEVSEEVVPEIYYAHAMALSASGQQDQARHYLVQAYQRLLTGAAQIEDEEARQAFFHRNPTMRRLMREVAAHGIAAPDQARVVSRTLPAARDRQPIRVTWTVDAGPADVALKQARGAIALRRARLSRLLQEAKAQGAAPSADHLAEALGVSKRTVQRDLAALRRSE